MSISRMPLPSIALVLALDRAPVPSRPPVIKFGFDPLQTIYPISAGPVLDPAGIPNDSNGVQIDQHDNVADVVDTIISSANDSSTDVGHSDDVQQDDGLLRSLKGLAGDVTLKGDFIAFKLTSAIRSLFFQLKLKISPMNEGAQATKAVVNE